MKKASYDVKTPYEVGEVFKTANDTWWRVKSVQPHGNWFRIEVYEFDRNHCSICGAEPVRNIGGFPLCPECIGKTCSVCGGQAQETYHHSLYCTCCKDKL